MDCNEEDGFAVLLPLFDLGNHATDIRADWVPLAAGEERHGDPGDEQVANAKLTATKARVEWIASTDIHPEQHVLNNYGMKTNSELLLGYGFIIPESDELHNDYVHIRTRWETGDGEPVDEVVEHRRDTEDTRTPQTKKVTRKDYLVSLRPLDDPSSLVGRARNLLYVNGDGHRELPETMRSLFAHVETELVWEIMVSLIGVEEAEAEETKGAHRVADIQTIQGELQRLVHRLPAEKLERLRTGTTMALTGKLLLELSKVDAEEFDETPTNRNQELARTYREQQRKVLLEALKSMGHQVRQGGA